MHKVIMEVKMANKKHFRIAIVLIISIVIFLMTSLFSYGETPLSVEPPQDDCQTEATGKTASMGGGSLHQIGGWRKPTLHPDHSNGEVFGGFLHTILVLRVSRNE